MCAAGDGGLAWVRGRGGVPHRPSPCRPQNLPCAYLHTSRHHHHHHHHPPSPSHHHSCHHQYHHHVRVHIISHLARTQLTSLQRRHTALNCKPVPAMDLDCDHFLCNINCAVVRPAQRAPRLRARALSLSRSLSRALSLSGSLSVRLTGIAQALRSPRTRTPTTLTAPPPPQLDRWWCGTAAVAASKSPPNQTTG